MLFRNLMQCEAWYVFHYKNSEGIQNDNTFPFMHTRCFAFPIARSRCVNTQGIPEAVPFHFHVLADL